MCLNFRVCFTGIDNQNNFPAPEPVSSEHSQDSESDTDVSDTDSSDGENDQNVNDEDQFVDGPIYNGAPITIAESLMAILTFYLRYTKKDVALEELLNLIILHCPPRNSCVRSMYRMKKILLKDCASPSYHYYCEACHKSLANIDSACDCLHAGKVKFYLTTPIKAQLQVMFKRPGFCDLLNYKNTRTKINPRNKEDIYDGEIYEYLSQPGRILSVASNLSFFWNTDDVAVFNSSSYNITPFYLTINELPPEERFKQENLILAGLWFGKSKPNPNLFMEGFCDELRELLFTGADFQTSEPDITRHVHCVVIGGTADLPAKALFMNFQQFNGEFGCQVCEARCEHINHVPTYAYQENAKLRTTADTVALAKLAETSGPQTGVKGASTLDKFVINYVESTVVDDMHCAYIGNTKQMIKLIIKSKHKDERWSLHNRLDILEDRMSKITPPNFVHRLSRPLAELKDWKAAELKNFLLFYALPLFYNLLPFDYYEHLKLFIVGMYLVSTRSISDEDIDNSEKMLNQFVNQFEGLYGRQNMLPNSHMLLHIPAGARKYGPVQLFSMFYYEDCNGKLKALIHGTLHAENQIVSGLRLFVHMKGFKEKFLNRRSPAVEFIERLEKSYKRRKLLHVTNNFKIVGLLKSYDKVPVTLSRLLANEGLRYRKIYRFNRMLQNGVYYESNEYIRTTWTNSMCIQFLAEGTKVIGLIQSFVKLYLCECDEMCQKTEECGSRYYAVVQKLDLANVILKSFGEMKFDSGFRCWFTGEQMVIDVQETDFVPCFFIYLGESEQSFVVVAPTTVRDK